MKKQLLIVPLAFFGLTFFVANSAVADNHNQNYGFLGNYLPPVYYGQHGNYRNGNDHRYQRHKEYRHRQYKHRYYRRGGH